MKAKLKIENVLSTHPKAVGLEMESYGVYRTCYEHPSRLRVITIRGVSDYGDESKKDYHHKNASLMASNFFLFFASICDLSHISNMDFIGDATKEKVMLRHTNNDPDVFSILVDETQKEFKVKGKSARLALLRDPLGVISLPKVLSLWAIRRVPLPFNERIQIGVDIEFNGKLTRPFAASFVSINLLYGIWDAYRVRVAENHRFTKSLFFPLPIFEETEFPTYNISSHRDLLDSRTFLEFRTAQEEPYLIGMRCEIGLKGGGYVSGINESDFFSIRIGNIDYATY